MTPYWICASFTMVSALVSLGYSAASLRVLDGDVREVTSRYAFVRSAALVAMAVFPLLDERPDMLILTATVMILVQLGDAVVGATMRDRYKTLGPASIALVNLGLLIWFSNT